MLIAAIIFMIAGFVGIIYVGVHVKKNTRVIEKPKKIKAVLRKNESNFVFDEHA